MDKAEITRRILDRDLPAERLLQLANVAHNDLKRLLRIRQRQEIVEVAAAVGAPRQVIGHEIGLQPLHQSGYAREVRGIEPIDGAQRQANGMDREAIVRPHTLHCGERGRRGQIVLGVDFEQARRRAIAVDFGEMRCAQADSRQHRHWSQLFTTPPTIFWHVPLGTAIQASGWLSFLEVPAQDELSVWQSFCPALDTPKHFSMGILPWACAAAGSAKALARAAAMAMRVGVMQCSGMTVSFLYDISLGRPHG